MNAKRNINILVAEDDEDDKLLITKAFHRVTPENVITCVSDGEQLIQYLNSRNQNSSPSTLPLPDIILLDLNMPKKDGKTALSEIKSHQDFKKIPVIIFTTSSLQSDVVVTYKLGGNSFITKPESFEGLVRIAREIENYWGKTVLLPG